MTQTTRGTVFERAPAKGTAPSSELATFNPMQNVDPKTLATLRQADSMIQTCAPAEMVARSVVERAIVMANTVGALRAILNDDFMRDTVHPLMDTPIGFKTDKPGQYDVDTVRECVIVALLRGANIIGNEFNIISKNTYFTREFFSRKLTDLVTDLRIDLSVPVMRNGGAVVSAKASWIVDGTKQEMACDIPVKVNAGMGADAILGKADRKIKYRIYCRVTGTSFTTDGEVDEADIVHPAPALTGDQKAQDAQAAIEQLRQQANAGKPETQPEKPEPEPQPKAEEPATDDKPVGIGDARSEPPADFQKTKKPKPWTHSQ